MSTTAENAARDADALKLRRAGISPQRIAAQLGYKTTAQAEKGISRALAASGTSADPAEVRALELDRLDQLQRAVWTAALGGDLKAVDQAQKLAEARVRLAGIAARGESVMTNAYDATVASLQTEPEDTSIIASGRRIAERIDTAAASGDALAETKALYLLPHLMNILRELGATPAARAELKAKAKSGDSDKRAKLTALRGGRTA
ncbi:hypothetical protein K8F61_17155 [Microbacterium resistens]|uniref:Terminase small subunit actinomycetes phage-type domain-containing protein n=1 Tax=Microbacterium resistens TaxID=156977 RepID=A0ABY3RTQ4_9MICO|nr:hypothetical protein [Microbacterium resistens]UGS26333.1 hypothetical protein K8F61_17155 [Microbacterium resistens]